MPAAGGKLIQLYRSITAGVRPPSLSAGELFFNQADAVLSWPDVSNNVKNTPIDQYLTLAADYANATTTLSNVFQFSAVANGVYEIDLSALWSGSATTVGLKLAILSPAGAAQGSQIGVSGTQSGVVAPTTLELGISGTAQNGPVAAVANVPLTARGTILVINAATAGTITLQAAATAAGTVTIRSGSSLRYRRVR